jgi:predicted DNA-binding mobile mystery protein A
MKTKYKKLMMQHLEKKIKSLKPLKSIGTFRKGWIRTVRNCLGMTSMQLAKRMGVTQARVIRIENDETTAAITLKTLKRAAHGLNCTLIYGLVPDEDIDKMLEKQAQRAAKIKIQYTDHTMALEKQDLPESSLKRRTNALKDELLDKRSSLLWEDE